MMGIAKAPYWSKPDFNPTAVKISDEQTPQHDSNSDQQNQYPYKEPIPTTSHDFPGKLHQNKVEKASNTPKPSIPKGGIPQSPMFEEINKVMKMPYQRLARKGFARMTWVSGIGQAMTQEIRANTVTDPQIIRAAPQPPRSATK